MLVRPGGGPRIKLLIHAFRPYPVDRRCYHQLPVVCEHVGVSIWIQEEDGSGWKKVLWPFLCPLDELVKLREPRAVGKW